MTLGFQGQCLIRGLPNDITAMSPRSNHVLKHCNGIQHLIEWYSLKGDRVFQYPMRIAYQYLASLGSALSASLN